MTSFAPAFSAVLGVMVEDAVNVGHSVVTHMVSVLRLRSQRTSAISVGERRSVAQCPLCALNMNTGPWGHAPYAEKRCRALPVALMLA